jgi:DNA invertase Pin-like site-specific DNA recombinase
MTKQDFYNEQREAFTNRFYELRKQGKKCMESYEIVASENNLSKHTVEKIINGYEGYRKPKTVPKQQNKA